MIDVYSEIRKRFGNIRRTRGYYLYTEKNIRLFDLWLDGGKAFLGRRTGQANLVCKQFLDRGLTGFIPTKADSQLTRALSALLPDYPVIRWYHSEEKAQRLIRTLLGTNEDIPVWRPCLEMDAKSQIMLVTPAYPVSYGIIASEGSFENQLPPSDPLFPPLVYSLARAFFDLQRKIHKQHTIRQNTGKSKSAESKKLTGINKQRAAVEQLIPSIWKQKSYYLFPHIPQKDYLQLFSDALDCHVLISPDYHIPSILPECGGYTELIKFLKTRIIA